MHKKFEAQERFLSGVCREKKLVWLYLVDGTRLEGYISSFDVDSIYFDDGQGQTIRKSAVCAVIPADSS